MLFVGHFKYTTEDNGGEFGSFSIVAEAENPDDAREVFRKRLSESRTVPAGSNIVLSGIIALPEKVDDGVMIAQTAFPGDIDFSALDMLPSQGKCEANLIDTGNESFSGIETAAIENETTDPSKTIPPLPFLSQENASSAWYMRWPDGSISVAIADTRDSAILLFDAIGAVAPEMVLPWKHPEMLLHFRFDITTGMWHTDSIHDTAWGDLMRELAPQLNFALNALHEMDSQEFDGPVISPDGQKVLDRALEEHSSEAQKEYDMIAAVHRARCEDPMCMFCIDEALSGKSSDKAGLA